LFSPSGYGHTAITQQGPLRVLLQEDTADQAKLTAANDKSAGPFQEADRTYSTESPSTEFSQRATGRQKAKSAAGFEGANASEMAAFQPSNADQADVESMPRPSLKAETAASLAAMSPQDAVTLFGDDADSISKKHGKLRELVAPQTSSMTSAPSSTNEKCFEEGTSWEPLDMQNQDMTVEKDVAACQRRCLGVPGCMHFSFFNATQNCHLQGAFAIHKPSSLGFVSGPFSCQGIRPGQEGYVNIGHMSYLPRDLGCLQVGTDYIHDLGTDYYIFSPEQDIDHGIVGMNTIRKCQQQCSITKDCEHVSVQFPTGFCNLASASAGRLVNIAGAVSGPRAGCNKASTEATHALGGIMVTVKEAVKDTVKDKVKEEAAAELVGVSPQEIALFTPSGDGHAATTQQGLLRGLFQKDTGDQIETTTAKAWLAGKVQEDTADQAKLTAANYKLTGLFPKADRAYSTESPSTECSQRATGRQKVKAAAGFERANASEMATFQPSNADRRDVESMPHPSLKAETAASLAGMSPQDAATLFSDDADSTQATHALEGIMVKDTAKDTVKDTVGRHLLRQVVGIGSVALVALSVLAAITAVAVRLQKRPYIRLEDSPSEIGEASQGLLV